MEDGDILATAGIAAFITWIVVLVVKPILRGVGIVDRPNIRSSHAVVTVRGGGVGVVAVVATIIVLSSRQPIQCFGLFVPFLAIAGISFVDDIRGVAPQLRFVLQAAAAGVGLWTLSGIITADTVILMAVSVVWVVGYTNAFNFMDGINGIAGVQGVMTGLATAFVGAAVGLPLTHPAIIIAAGVAGAALGFLPHNFPAAKIFMGDVGSAPLGFLLAALTFWIACSTQWWVLFWLGLLHANFVLDTAITMARRAIRGDRLHEAHREHFYQRLVRAGYSHTFVTLTEAGLQVIVCVAVWAATPSTLAANAEVSMQNLEWIKMLAVAAGVVCVWLAFFAFAEVRFRAFLRLQQAVPAPSRLSSS
jgi:UDP-N-acetylmuramyl pentapeptide phosphotransferase/UDP-N-acetylglucosamine-1-phosphate transferase